METQIADPIRAKRLARAIISDIASYHRERILQSIGRDGLFEEMSKEIQEAETLYRSKVEPQVFEKHPFLEHAIVDLLFCIE